MAKPTISLPDGLLEEVDRRAADAGVSRSSFIQEAIAHYATDLDTRKAQTERERRITEAIAQARRIAESMPPGTDGAAIIRAERDAPPRWMREENHDDRS